MARGALQTRAPERAATGLTVRSLRTGALVLAVTFAFLMLVAVRGIASTALVRNAGLSSLADNPALRALYGRPYDLSTPGGFVVWRLGQFLALAAALWGLLSATRLLRGEEDAGRTDLVLAGSLRRSRLVGAQLGVLGGACVVVGLGIAVGLVVAGQAGTAAALFGAGVTTVMLVFAMTGALTAQLVAPRRRATGLAVALLATTFLLRMLADGSAGLAAATWATPFGWLERLEPFAGNRPWPLLPGLVVASLLAAAAVALALRRDTGEGVVQERAHRPRRAGLGGPAAFALRERTGAIAGWVVGLAVVGFVVGGITDAFTDFLARNAALRDLMARFGYREMASPEGFVAALDVFAAVALGACAIASVYRIWDDEEQARLDHVFAAPVRRARWIAAALVATVVVVAASGAAYGVAIWVGVEFGKGSIAFADVLAGVLNTLPVVALVLGLAVLGLGLVPRIGAAIAGGVLAAWYVLNFLGPALSWPSWVLDLTPFRHLAAVPAQPAAWAATAIMLAIAALELVVGIVAYERRDLR
jgi:ABC-2 type transport system permease protein